MGKRVRAETWEGLLEVVWRVEEELISRPASMISFFIRNLGRKALPTKTKWIREVIYSIKMANKSEFWTINAFTFLTLDSEYEPKLNSSR